MLNAKRLFLFAGYDQDGVIDDALIYYLSNLAKFGDVVFYMDNDCAASEIDKIKKYTLCACAARHGEYDFGSYKRGYIWARDNNILQNYDYVYMVNDSVFGPLMEIERTLNNIESYKSDAAGLVVAHHRTHSYMESWFVRLNKTIFLAEWFDKFLSGIKHERKKTTVTTKYEHGLSNLIASHNYSWDGVYHVNGRFTYNHPRNLFLRGCPFVKKASFVRHNGAIGNQIKYIMAHANQDAIAAILVTANRVYGEKYMRWLLTSNPLKILWRNITYVFKKFIGGAK